MKIAVLLLLLFLLIAKSQSAIFQNASGSYDCYYRCQSCTDVSSQSCTSCFANYILANNSCLPCADNCLSCVAATGLCQNCASQFYLSQSTWTCKPCPIGADTCTFSAIQQCLPGYYLVNSICLFCIANCQTCSDPYSCSVCNTGYYLTKEQTCSQCQIAYCSSCDQTGACSLCSNNRYGVTCDQLCPLNCEICDGSACYQCNSGYYQSSLGTCQALSILCDSGIDPFACISCLQEISFLDGYVCYPYTYVHLTNQQIYQRPQNEMNLFSGELVSCGNYWFARDNGMLSISINVQPSYKLKLKIQVMTQQNTTNSITIASNQLKETFIGSILSKFAYSCLNDTWIFTNFQANFTPLFTASSKNQVLNLSIIGNGSIGVGQVLIEEYLCLVSQCGLCLSAYSCMQCLSPYLLQNNKCLAQCSSGYYLTQQLMTCTLSCPTYFFPNLADYSCTPCISPCLACKSSSQCLSCITGWFLLGNTCQTSCPAGYYSNSTLNSCVTCQYPCATCDFSASNCSSCSLGFLDKGNGNCVMSCSDGYFSNFSSITCSHCSSQCLTCQFSSSRCTSCSSPSFLNPNSTCLPACDSTYAVNSLLNICEKCQYPCRTCNASAVSCLTCYSGYLQNQNCVSTCSMGFYSDFQYKECMPCPINCLSCVSKLQCTSCGSGFYYSQFLQSCDSLCSPGSFANSNATCSLCRSPCSQCLNSTYCLSCEGYLFVYNYGSCLLSCPKGTFLISNQTTNQKYCEPCGINCSVCISSNNCVTCSNSSSLYQGSCLMACPDTTYNLKGVCSNCSFPCNTCQASDICLSCVTGYYYYGVSNSCLRICPSGFYASGQYCLPCNQICELCNDGSSNCLTCAVGYFKNSNGTCSQTCGFKQYTYPIQRICKKCGSPCIECLSSNLCTSCNTSSIYPYLFRKSCVASCPNGYFANSTFSCQQCSSNCLYCSKSFDNCTQCDGDHYLFSNISNKCVQNCPDQYYPNSAGQCTPCLPPCMFCVSQSACLSCISQSYYFYNGNCLTACPFGYYSASNICESCDQACLQCYGNSLNCTQCPPNLFLMSQNGTNNSECLKNCPKYYYPDVMNQICSLCVSPCLLCFTASRCISCETGFVLQFDTCLLNCISGYYNEGDVCKPCQSPCATCTSNKTCLSCITNYFFDQNDKKCLNQCPSATYSFQTSNRDLQCLSCPTSCLQCYDSISCRSCQPNSLLPYLQGTTCQATCTDGYYAIPNSLTCQWCGWGCLSCDSSGICTQCSNSYLYGGVCQTQCPIGYYGSISFSCEMCISPCYDCYNAANCEFCIPGYFLYLTHCLSKCPEDQWAFISLSICNQTCNAPYYKNPLDKTCVTSCPSYYDADGNCVDLCPSELMANQTFGCEECETADCSKRLQYQLVSYQQNGQLFVIMVFNLPLDNLNELTPQSLSLTLNPSVAIDPSQLNLSGLRTLTEVISIENSVTVVSRQSLSITLQLNLQKYGQVFSGIIAQTVKNLNVLTTGGYPLQAQNATVTLDEYQANSGGSFAEYFGWIVSCILLLAYIANVVCGSERNVMLAIDGIQTIHALFYLSVWNHPLLENYMLGLGFGTLRTYISNFSIQQNLWNCPPKYIVLYGYCNTYIQLVFPLLALIVIIVVILICRFISIFEGKHKFLWNHANSIWWILGMSVGISSFKGVTSPAFGEFIISTVLLVCFLVFSLIIGFKIVENVYSNSFADSCFFWDLKKKKAEHILSNLHCLLMVVRRVVIVIAAGLGYQHPLSSLFVVTLLTICIFSNIIINRPFKNYGMMVGAAELLFGLILVLIQMYIVNTSRLSNTVWNGFGTLIFVLVLVYTLILLVLGFKQTIKCIRKLYLKRLNQKKGGGKQKSIKSMKQVQSQASKKEQQKSPPQQEDHKEEEKIGDETQHHLMKASLSSKRSQSQHIFSQCGGVDYQKQPAAPKLLLKIQKESDEYHSFKKIENS